MKILHALIVFGTYIFLSGCNESNSTTAPTTQPAVKTPLLTTVTIERGSVFFANVLDANDQIAKAGNNGFSNVYNFETEPQMPISVSGGYIDIDKNGILDINDIVLDINMSSYSNIVSPITTFVGNNQKLIEKLKGVCEISEDEIFKTIPSQTSTNAILCSNILYKSLKNNYAIDSAEFNQTVTEVHDTYNQSFSQITDLDILSIALEKELVKAMNISLSTVNIADINNLLKALYIEKLDINNSTFIRNKKTTDDVSDIWNLALEIPQNQDVADFDIGIHILKSSSGTIGNIIISGISIKDNKFSVPKNVYIFGKKTNGTTSSVNYDSAKDITKNSVALIQNKLLLIDLGYIIKNQTIITADGFSTAAKYELNVYISKLDVNGSITHNITPLQVSVENNYEFASSSQEINGTINITEQ